MHPAESFVPVLEGGFPDLSRRKSQISQIYPMNSEPTCCRQYSCRTTSPCEAQAETCCILVVRAINPRPKIPSNPHPTHILHRLTTDSSCMEILGCNDVYKRTCKVERHAIRKSTVPLSAETLIWAILAKSGTAMSSSRAATWITMIDTSEREKLGPKEQREKRVSAGVDRTSIDL